MRGEVCVCGGGEVEHPSLIIEMPGQGGAREVATPLSVWRANTRFWVAAGKFKRFALSNFTAWETVQRLLAALPPQLGKSSNQSHSFGICLL